MTENINPNRGFQSFSKAMIYNDDEDFVEAPPKKRIKIEGDKLIFSS